MTNNLPRDGQKGFQKTHGQSGRTLSAEYRVWGNMITRCCNERNPAFPRYGGRGITVCDRWRNNFTAFFEDMGPRPSPKHSLDRIDNDGHYEPANCRWATMKAQSRNRRTSVLITHEGRTQCASAWAEEIGITIGAMHRRLKKWPVALAITLPFQPRTVRPRFKLPA